MLKIRTTTEKDIQEILSFIREIAEFERLSDAVTATEADLRQSLFSENPAAQVLLFDWNDHPVAYAVYFFTFSTFLGKRGMWLEDVFVRPEFRSQGIGKKIISHLATIAVENNCGRFEWMVLDWNERAQKFYDSLGAELLKEWRINRVNEENIKNLASK